MLNQIHKAMKKLIVISVIMLAGFSVSAQNSGRTEVPECYKCIFQEIQPLHFLELLVPPFYPYLPKVEKVIKSDRINEAYPVEPRMLTNPGYYIENYNQAIPVSKKMH